MKIYFDIIKYNIIFYLIQVGTKTSLEALDEIESEEDDEEEYLQELEKEEIFQELKLKKNDKKKEKNLYESSLINISLKLKKYKESKINNKKEYRKKIPQDLIGKKKREIYEETGIKNIMFVNKNGTSAISKDLMGILSLAEYALYK